MTILSRFRNRKTLRPSNPLPRTKLAVNHLEDRCTPSFGFASAGGDMGNAVATDGAGNVYQTGSFTSSFTPAGSSTAIVSAGGSDIFVTKYSRSGAFQWAVSLGGAGNDSGNGIAVDGGGTTVNIVGQYAGGYVVQLNAATGAVNWSRAVSGTTGDAVTMDGSGAAYVTSHQGTSSSYLTKLNSGGTTQWLDTFSSSPGVFYRPSVAVAGNAIYVGGTYVTGGAFSIGSSTYNVTTTKNTSAGYVLKLTNENIFSWVQTYQSANGNSHIMSHSVATDGAGNVYSFGEYIGKVAFGNKTLNAGNNNEADFVAKLTPAGTVSWAKQFGNSPASLLDKASGIAVDGSGAIYLTGSFSGTASFNPAGGGNLTSAGSNDIFVSKLDTDGNFQWSVKAGGTGDDRGKGIAVSVYGDIFLTGSIDAGTAWFDPTHSLTMPVRTGFLWQILQP